MTDRFFALGGGGLGDFLIAYFGLIPGHYSGFLKAGNVTGYKKLCITSHNPACIDVVRYDDRFNELEFLPYKPGPELKRALLEWGRDIGDQDVPATDTPFVYPAHEDFDLFDECGIMDEPDFPFAVVHPWCNGHRIIPDPIGPVGDQLTLVIGADNWRTWTTGAERKPERVRVADGVIDLTNVCNARQACLLIQYATEFHGGLSAYCWAAAAFETPSTIYCQAGLDNDYTRLLARFKHMSRVEV